MPDAIMTVQEMAAYLKVDPQTVYRRFRAGKLPGVRIGRAIRFKRDLVDSWLLAASWPWGDEDRKALRRRLKGIPERLGIRQSDVVAIVRAHRRRGR